MTAASGSRGALDCLRRGLASALANWQLAPLLLLQSVLTAALTAAGFLVPLALVGIGVAAWIRGAGADWPQRLAEELTNGVGTPPPLVGLVWPLTAAALLWSAAFLLYCYFQGGVVGLLVESDGRAGAGLPPRGAFRRFSLTDFDRAGRRLFWRYFWLNHLIGVVALGWALLAALLAGAAMALAERVAPAAGVTLGCSSLLPLGLLLAAVTIWSLLATVAAAQPGGGVVAAGREALRILRRRPGSVLLLSFVAFVAWVGVGTLFLPLGWGIDLAAGDQWLPRLGASGVLMAVEALADCGLLLALLAALTALVAGERREVGP